MLFLRQGRPTPSMLGKLQLKKEAERMVAARQAPAGAGAPKKGGNSQQTLAIIFPTFPHINYGKVSCHGEDEAARNRMVEIGKIVGCCFWGDDASLVFHAVIHEIIKNNSIMVG